MNCAEWDTGAPAGPRDVQACTLADLGYRVVAYDRRGFGRSGKPASADISRVTTGEAERVARDMLDFMTR